jgi:PAS domain S-box-containing protein
MASDSSHDLRSEWLVSMPQTDPLFSKRTLIERVAYCVAFTGLGYYFGAKLGLALTFQPHPIAVLWPPNSILLAALLLTPLRGWWIVLAAAFVAHLAAELMGGVPMGMVLCWFVSNSLQALIGAGLMRASIRGPPHFERLRDLGLFIAYGALLAPFLASFLDTAFVTWTGWGAGSYWELWRLRFFSNVLATLILVPPIVTWFSGGLGWLRTTSWPRLAEEGAFSVGLMGVSWVAFAYNGAAPDWSPVLLYAPLPFLLWAAVRFGLRGTSTAILIVALLSIWDAVHERGPFAGSSSEEGALSIQLFLIVVSLPLLTLAAVMAERRRAESALRASEERFAKAFRFGPDAVAIVRIDDATLIDVNERWESLFGHTRAEVQGRTAAEINLYVNPADRDTFYAKAKKTGFVRDFEIDMRTRLGRVRRVVLNAETVQLGGAPGFIILVRDMTDQRQAEREAHEQREQLAHLTRVAMLGGLSGALAHELNQPLTAILSNAQAGQRLLQKTPVDLQDLREIFEDIEHADKRAGEVIKRLRALLKKGDAQRHPVDVKDLVHEVLELTHADLVACNVEVITRLNENLPRVLGDRVQLQQVLLNLVVNACDAMRSTTVARRRLTVLGAVDEGGRVRISVADCGSGLDGTDLERLFEPFVTTKEQGLGVGLSISRAVVTAHGGRLWAETNGEGGATFHVSLPVQS